MKKLLAFLLSVMLIFALSTAGFADFGDFAGDSDWGGGYDSGGWDSGSWDSGWDSDYDYSWDSGYNYNNDYYYDSDSSGEWTAFDIIVTAVIVLIILAAVFGGSAVSKKSSGNKRVAVNTQRTAPLVNDLAGLKQRDPNFNESKFLADAANLYVRLQNAWTDKDLTPVRTHLAEELYAKSERQIQAYIKNKQTDNIERISVLSTDIVGCTKDNKNDVITVQLVARIVDYVTDDRTGNVIRGDRNKELFMTYQWTFIRTLGKVTELDERVDDKHCPNCGAPLDLNQSAVCEYCGSVCTSGDYDWVVSDIRGISQRSN